MKKIIKRTLSVLLVALMIFGSYMPISNDLFPNILLVEANAATVTSTTTGKFVILLPAGVKMYSCSSATGSKNSTPYFYSSSEQLTIYATEEVILSSGSNRFLITANTSSGVRTLYYELPSSASAYKLPDAPGTIYISGKICKDQDCKLTWSSDQLVNYYIVELYDQNGNLVSNKNVYAPLNLDTGNKGDTVWSENLGSRVKSGLVSESFSVYITPVRQIGYEKYYGNESSYENVSFNCCQGTVGASSYIYGITYNANGGYGGPSEQEWLGLCSGTTTISYSMPSRGGYTFLGWSTSAYASSPSYYPGDTVSYNHNRLSLYAVWKENAVETYTVYYNSNGGSGAPSSQTKTKDETLWLSSTKPTKTYTVTYNANGGSVSPTSKNVNCTFVNWNTSQNGSGTTYSSGSNYTANSGATLYAQWNNPTYGTLPVPTRNDYSFEGWYTSSTGGTLITSSSTVSSNTTIYARWKKAENIYNLGEETYSFRNYVDSDSRGHCFGMSVTSSGYFLECLDINSVGVDTSRNVNQLADNAKTRAPICYYQNIQGNPIARSIVAGYKNDSNLSWNQTIEYVNNHNFDNKGNLVVLTKGASGHAVNFLYYKNVNGQDRIYVYDNNFPSQETYYYLGTDNLVYQAPKNTLSYARTIGLMSVTKYMEEAKTFDFSRAIYAYEGEISIQGIEGFPMFGSDSDIIRYVYELPVDQGTVEIKPLTDNAEFEYLGETMEFGQINDNTIGYLELGTEFNGTVIDEPRFTIVNEGNGKVICIKTPSSSTISYGDAIILHADGTLPEGARIEWTADNGNFNMSVSSDGTSCKISPKSSGNTTFTATAYDKDGNVIDSGTQTMTAKADLWQKIVAFFKKIFGLTKTIPEAFDDII